MSGLYRAFINTTHPFQMSSTTSISLQNRQNSLKQNLYIQSDIPLGNIFCVQPDNLFKICNITSATNLPHTGNAWFDGYSGSVVKFILFQLIRQNRSGSNQAHGSVKYIPELWKLIQRCFSDKFSNAGFLSSIWQDLVSDHT